MKETLKTWLFLLVLSLIVSVSLTAISSGLRGRIERNLRMVQVRSILEVLDVAGRDDKTDAELLALFDQKVAPHAEQPGVYVYRDNRQVQAIAFEVVGRGLWDQIKGLVAVEKDGRTIRGVRFYEQNETPGLGGEIGTPAFERHFVGKVLYRNGEILNVVKPGVKPDLSETEVHGITGATLTVDSVNVILKQAITQFKEIQDIPQP